MTCMGSGSTFTLTMCDTMVSSSTTRNRALVSTNGLMDAGMKDGGTKESSMGSELTWIARKEPSSTVSGKTERESNGSMIKLLLKSIKARMMLQSILKNQLVRVDM